MQRGWDYRVLSVVGTVLLTVAAVLVTNLPVIHGWFDQVPVLGGPAPEVLSGSEVTMAIATSLVVVLVSMWPLFKPRPRRILDTVLLTQKRVLLAMTGLAAIGYFNYTYRLPRTTLMLTAAALLVTLPLYMIAISQQPKANSRAIIVGDDPDAMESLLDTSAVSVHGYVSPPSAYAADGTESRALTDGGTEVEQLEALPCLGGLARLDEVIVEEDIDTALLAFSWTDREEFFGTLETCHDHGVNALVHKEHADHVLTDDIAGKELLQVDLEPLDWQDYALKRLFDVTFATVALVVLSPVIALIALAIKLDDGGPILYGQQRTAAFGRTFQIYKFRSMTPDEEDDSPDSEEEYRVTRAGHVLRKTHMDEIPQLWSILTGKMSVVGPRAVWTDEETHLESEASAWRKRWFIKPGLTGLAQINDVTSADAEGKLRYDLEYIRRQSFWFDLKIVVRQLWGVGADALGFVIGRDPEGEESENVREAGDEGETDEERTERKKTVEP